MTSAPDPVPRRPRPSAAAGAEALVEQAVEAIVRTADPQACTALVDALEERGALWEGMLALLGPTAGLRIHGLSEQQAVKQLAAWAGTPDAVTALTYRLWEQLRSRGTAAAREVRDVAEAGVRRGAALQLLVVYCSALGGRPAGSARGTRPG